MNAQIEFRQQLALAIAALLKGRQNHPELWEESEKLDDVLATLTRNDAVLSQAIRSKAR